MNGITRRALLGTGIAAGAASTMSSALADTGGVKPGDPLAAPFSTGANRPDFHVPHGAVDAHIHIFDPVRFPYPNPTSTPPPQALVQDYLVLRERLLTTRTVVVTPSNYATDNRCTLDAIAQLGQKNARGVAVVDATFTDAQLLALHEGGIRGIRFNLTRPGGAGAELIRPLSARVASLGWHVQVHMTADGIVANESILTGLPTGLVFDHMGRIPGESGTDHPAYGVIMRLVDSGRTWVKVSGVYHESVVGPPTYADRSALGAAFVHAAPERMVWGSDWPHPTASRGEVPMPNDADLLNLLASWAVDHQTIKQILVRNPSELYGF